MDDGVPDRAQAQSPEVDAYHWDDAQSMDRVEGLPTDYKSSTRSRKRTGTSSSTRLTIRWPFHNSRPETPSTTVPLSNSFNTQRRRGSAPLSILRPASSLLDMDIIPDYVVNFIRGETPESLARKREYELRNGQHNTEVNPGHTRNNHSRVADLYFPTMENGDGGEKGMNTPRDVKNLLTGWRGGVALNVLLAFILLVAAAACLIVAAVRAGALGGESTLVSGVCSTVRNTVMGLHALVNILAFVLIAGANYVFQVLSSPTREEVDMAHERMQWLDIGIPSFRNLRVSWGRRGVLVVATLLLAIGSQIIYNSIIFAVDDSDICRLAVSRPAIGVLAILNLLAVIILSVTWFGSAAFEPLVTLGDALASFLSEPDSATRGAGLLTRAEASTGNWNLDETRRWGSQSRGPWRWAFTASATRWILWAASWVLPVALAGVALGVSLNDSTDDTFTLKSFGRPNSAYEASFDASRFGFSLLVALPHLFLAGLYISTNALLTTFWLARELSRFAIPGRIAPLRISSGAPLGAQVSSLYLTLPRPLSWLLFVVFAAAGFVLSQAVFVVSAPDARPALGLSPLALVILLGILLLIGILVLTLALLSVDSRGSAHPGEDAGQQVAEGVGAGNPLSLIGGTCSAVISSRCHPDYTEGPEMAFVPLGWGVVREETGSTPGRATFSSQPLGVVRVGRAYA